MRLDQLHIQNFRCYEDATFDFQPGFNLVVGVNGSGKTSLLQAVANVPGFGDRLAEATRTLNLLTGIYEEISRMAATHQKVIGGWSNQES